MTIEEIEFGLPNGLHDAVLTRINIDYLNRCAKFYIKVNVSDFDSKELAEQYRSGRLDLYGLLFCIIEPPDTRYPYQYTKSLWLISSGSTKPEKSSSVLPQFLPDGVFTHYFFVNDWNSFICVAAMDAQFEWIDNDTEC